MSFSPEWQVSTKRLSLHISRSLPVSCSLDPPALRDARTPGCCGEPWTPVPPRYLHGPPSEWKQLVLISRGRGYVGSFAGSPFHFHRVDRETIRHTSQRLWVLSTPAPVTERVGVHKSQFCFTSLHLGWNIPYFSSIKTSPGFQEIASAQLPNQAPLSQAPADDDFFQRISLTTH